MAEQADVASGPSAEHVRDLSLQIATARLLGDRELSADLILDVQAESITAPLLPSKVIAALADLLALVHGRWSDATGADRVEGWEALLADIEEWRMDRG